MSKLSSSLQVGDLAPDFVAPVTGGGYAGESLRLSDLRGQVVVLYFYPKDATPGCTTQACAIRDGWDRIADKATVLGVSGDSLRSHDRFIAKQSLPFALIADEGHAVAQAYGVWVEKKLYGRTYMGIERSTFVIAPDGRLQAVLRQVKPDRHLEQVLEVL